MKAGDILPKLYLMKGFYIMINPNIDLKELFMKSELIPAIITDWKTGEVLMLAYMSEKSLELTLSEGKTWFWSRSRQELWNKGKTSGHFQIVKSIDADCDLDTLLVKVEQVGGIACHTGNRSCFFNNLYKSDD